MWRFLIVMRHDFDTKELRDIMRDKKLACVFVVDNCVVVSGKGTFGKFCSTLWHCQKYGEVKCEVSRLQGGDYGESS